VNEVNYATLHLVIDPTSAGRKVVLEVEQGEVWQERIREW
jgi:hypothetical protein